MIEEVTKENKNMKSMRRSLGRIDTNVIWNKNGNESERGKKNIKSNKKIFMKN